MLIYLMTFSFHTLVLFQSFEWLCMINIITSHEIRDIHHIMATQNVKRLSDNIEDIRQNFEEHTHRLQQRFKQKEFYLKMLMMSSMSFLVIAHIWFPFKAFIESNYIVRSVYFQVEFVIVSINFLLLIITFISLVILGQKTSDVRNKLPLKEMSSFFGVLMVAFFTFQVLGTLVHKSGINQYQYSTYNYEWL